MRSILFFFDEIVITVCDTSIIFILSSKQTFHEVSKNHFRLHHTWSSIYIRCRNIFPTCFLRQHSVQIQTDMKQVINARRSDLYSPGAIFQTASTWLKTIEVYKTLLMLHFQNSIIPAYKGALV